MASFIAILYLFETNLNERELIVCCLNELSINTVLQGCQYFFWFSLMDLSKSLIRRTLASRLSKHKAVDRPVARGRWRSSCRRKVPACVIQPKEVASEKDFKRRTPPQIFQRGPNSALLSTSAARPVLTAEYARMAGLGEHCALSFPSAPFQPGTRPSLSRHRSQRLPG